MPYEDFWPEDSSDPGNDQPNIDMAPGSRSRSPRNSATESGGPEGNNYMEMLGQILRAVQDTTKQLDVSLSRKIDESDRRNKEDHQMLEQKQQQLQREVYAKIDDTKTEINAQVASQIKSEIGPVKEDLAKAFEKIKSIEETRSIHHQPEVDTLQFPQPLGCWHQKLPKISIEYQTLPFSGSQHSTARISLKLQRRELQELLWNGHTLVGYLRSRERKRDPTSSSGWQLMESKRLKHQIELNVSWRAKKVMIKSTLKTGSIPTIQMPKFRRNNRYEYLFPKTRTQDKSMWKLLVESSRKSLKRDVLRQDMSFSGSSFDPPTRSNPTGTTLPPLPQIRLVELKWNGTRTSLERKAFTSVPWMPKKLGERVSQTEDQVSDGVSSRWIEGKIERAHGITFRNGQMCKECCCGDSMMRIDFPDHTIGWVCETCDPTDLCSTLPGEGEHECFAPCRKDLALSTRLDRALIPPGNVIDDAWTTDNYQNNEADFFGIMSCWIVDHKGMRKFRFDYKKGESHLCTRNTRRKGANCSRCKDKKTIADGKVYCGNILPWIAVDAEGYGLCSFCPCYLHQICDWCHERKSACLYHGLYIGNKESKTWMCKDCIGDFLSTAADVVDNDIEENGEDSDVEDGSDSNCYSIELIDWHNKWALPGADGSELHHNIETGFVHFHTGRRCRITFIPWWKDFLSQASLSELSFFYRITLHERVFVCD